MVVTAEMRGVNAMGRRDVRYDIGPYITLINGPEFPALWQERQTLLRGQLTGADLVAVNKIDLLNADRLAEISQTLNGLCRKLMPLSARSGEGLEEVVQALI